MINLLPPDAKSNYRYGRRNVGLRLWVAVCLVALLGLGGLATYGLATLHRSTASYTAQIAASQALFQKEQFTKTQSQIQDITSSFKLVTQVLGQEVLFSKLLQQIATIIPANAALTGLNITQAKGGIDLTAVAPDYATATQVEVNLADPANKIFSQADITSIACTTTSNTGSSSGSGQTNSKYPCTVSIRALFASDNPYLFINSQAATP
jgi:Tfp pilus assembly protein PilN